MDGRKIADYLVQTAPKEAILMVSYSDNWRLSEGECDSHTICNVSKDKIVKRCRFFLHKRRFKKCLDVFSGMQNESIKQDQKIQTKEKYWNLLKSSLCRVSMIWLSHWIYTGLSQREEKIRIEIF